MAYPVPPALKIHDGLGPQRPEDGNLLLAAPPPIVKIRIEGFKLHGIPANPDPKAEAAPADEIDLRRLLGDQGRLTLRENEDTGDEFQRRRAGRQIPHHHQGFVEGVLMTVRGTRQRRMVGMIGPEHMVGHDQVRKPEAFDRLHKIPHRQWIIRNFALRKGNAYFHRLLLSPLHPAPCSL